MQPILFQTSSAMIEGKYLLGGYSWSKAVQFSFASLICRPPTSGSVTLQMEVDGVLTNNALTIGAGVNPEVKLERKLSVVVGPGEIVRWKITASTVIDTAGMLVEVMMQPVDDALGRRSIPVPVLALQWVAGTKKRPEKIVLYSYDCLNHDYTSVSEVTASRAVVVNTGPDEALSIALEDTIALKVEGGKILVNEFHAVGSSAASEVPRLEFLIDDVVIASLTKTGILRVANIEEAVPAVLEAEDVGFNSRFEFYSGGVLTAVLAATGLTATTVEEPIT